MQYSQMCIFDQTNRRHSIALQPGETDLRIYHKYMQTDDGQSACKCMFLYNSSSICYALRYSLNQSNRITFVGFLIRCMEFSSPVQLKSSRLCHVVRVCDCQNLIFLNVNFKQQIILYALNVVSLLLRKRIYYRKESCHNYFSSNFSTFCVLCSVHRFKSTYTTKLNSSTPS